MDLNEPQQGKDQRDLDLALGRSVFHSFVDEGNNILTAEDIFNVLTTSVINDTKISVVPFKKDNFKLTCTPIDGASIYHSFTFTEAGMKILQCWSEVFRKYTEDWSFHSGAVTIKEFIVRKTTTKIKKKKKECADRQLCKIVFCKEKG